MQPWRRGSGCEDRSAFSRLRFARSARGGGFFMPPDFALAGGEQPFAGIKHTLPIRRPSKIICLALNYLEPVKEGSQRDNIPEFPTIFMRGLTSLEPHGEPIIRPQLSETLDYEPELILVVGKR